MYGILGDRRFVAINNKIFIKQNFPFFNVINFTIFYNEVSDIKTLMS